MEGLSAAVGGTENERAPQQSPDNAEGLVTSVAPPISIETRPKVISERISQENVPGSNEITRETSREDALAATRCFFSTVPERGSAMEVPVTTMTSVSQTDTPPVTSVPVETERSEPSPVRTLLPSGSPPRPTATATLRPRMLEQRLSEGQIEEQTQDDDESEENNTLEPLVIEGLPDELGPEWRILHPFEIPGVRCPTEDTPPNHRRLAENDTLVELIQTAEYLEDGPSWEQRRFYPPRYGDPYYRGHGRGCGRGRGRGRGWLNEDVPGRNLGGGQGRFHFRGNGRDQDGQYRSGVASIHDEGRDIRLEMPPELEPSRFSDWSSIASPPIRTSPHSAPDVQIAQNDNTQNQLNIGTRQERVEASNSEGVTIAIQTELLRENQNIPARPIILTQRNDLGSHERNVDNVPHAPAPSRSASLHTDDVVLTNAPRRSSTNDELSRSSQLRSHDVNIEGISSICPVDSSIMSGIRQIVLDNRGSGPSYQHEGIHPPRTSTANKRDSSDSSDNDRFRIGRGYANERGRPPEREREIPK